MAADGEVTGPVNIGHGQETSVLDLLEALRDVGGSDAIADPEFAPERLGEVRRSCLDVTRAREELGWQAQVSLRDGLRVILRGIGVVPTTG
jgi:UDP-glucose 4-epimerase